MKRLTHKARVLIVDGAHALVLRNDGDTAIADFKLVRAYGQDNPPTREQGSDRPGRTNDSFGRRSTMEQTDWHQLTEDRFIQQVAEEMAKDLSEGEFTELAVVAPAAALGEFRKVSNNALTRATVLEVDKDLTNHTVPEIETILMRMVEQANLKA